MGIEIFKVTGQIVRDSKGQKANLLSMLTSSIACCLLQRMHKYNLKLVVLEHHIMSKLHKNFTGRVTDGEGQTSFNWNRIQFQITD